MNWQGCIDSWILQRIFFTNRILKHCKPTGRGVVLPKWRIVYGVSRNPVYVFGLIECDKNIVPLSWTHVDAVNFEVSVQRCAVCFPNHHRVVCDFNLQDCLKSRMNESQPDDISRRTQNSFILS